MVNIIQAALEPLQIQQSIEPHCRSSHWHSRASKEAYGLLTPMPSKTCTQKLAETADSSYPTPTLTVYCTVHTS